MALLFGDGFDHYSLAAQVLQKWDFASSGGSNSGPSTTYGRLGSRGIQTAGTAGAANQPALGKNLSVNVANFGITGVAFNIPTIGSSGQHGILHYLDPAVSSLSYVGIFVMANGAVRAESPVGTVIGITGPGLVSANAFRYLEGKVKIHNTAGRVIVRLDSIVIIDTGAGGINTRPYGTTNTFSRVGMGGVMASGTIQNYFDDFYACDDTGAVNNDFLGDVQLQAIYPDAPGSSAAWTKGGTTPAATNWQSVKETSPDDDVTYVKSSTVGNLDMYNMQNVSATASEIKGLLINARIKKDDATSRSYATQVQDVASAGAVTALPTRPVPGNYLNQQDVSEVSPTTGVAWTVAQVNAMEAGIKVIT